MTKSQILRGVRFAFEDVATIKRGSVEAGRPVFNLRHVWPDSTDARVLDAVRASVRRRARDVAATVVGVVEVYSAHGDLLFIVEPQT